DTTHDDVTETTDGTSNSITGAFDQTKKTHSNSGSDDTVTTLMIVSGSLTAIVSGVSIPNSTADDTTHTSGNNITGAYTSDDTATSHAERYETGTNQTLGRTADRTVDTTSSSSGSGNSVTGSFNAPFSQSTPPITLTAAPGHPTPPANAPRAAT